MTRYLLLVIGVVFCCGLSLAQHNIRFEIRSVPPDHPPGSRVFIAGAFNGWNPRHPDYQMKQDGATYFLDVRLNPGRHEFKFTRGGWEKVECRRNGENISNRMIEVTGAATHEFVIEGWRDNYPIEPPRHSANSNVQVLDTAFAIPQLGRTRRIWIYLPPGYRAGKKYPVLYMHDGQNVFDNATSGFGEWGVDESLDTLVLKSRPAIVVAVDHGGLKRLNEYSPYDFELPGAATGKQLYTGEGDQYVDFLVKTLKPFIDKRYRTRKNRKNTFIAGSSMGGLISMYALLKYPKTFGGAGVFSPAFWVAPKIYDDIRARGHKVKSKIYFYAGIPESETMAPNTLRAFEEMQKVSKSKMVTVIRAEGQHDEARWRLEFPLLYQWLFD